MTYKKRNKAYVTNRNNKPFMNEGRFESHPLRRLFQIAAPCSLSDKVKLREGVALISDSALRMPVPGDGARDSPKFWHR